VVDGFGDELVLPLPKSHAYAEMVPSESLATEEKLTESGLVPDVGFAEIVT
jgi:hypothetical protein